MSFNDFNFKYKLKNRATSNIIICQVFSSIGLDKVGMYVKDDLFERCKGFVNLQPTERTQWVAYRN